MSRVAGLKGTAGKVAGKVPAPEVGKDSRHLHLTRGSEAPATTRQLT
jgi:hypothetical protein